MSHNQHQQTIKQGKIFLAAMIGAAIGAGAALHTYYSVVGGSDQSDRIAQIEKTVEYNRKVSEETLILFKQLHSGMGNHTANHSAPLSENPTQRELTEALDSLFEGIEEPSPAEMAEAEEPAPESAVQEALEQPEPAESEAASEAE